jgi:hypothetical protein
MGSDVRKRLQYQNMNMVKTALQLQQSLFERFYSIECGDEWKSRKNSKAKELSQA